jgi:hypothetical protein
MFIKLAVTRTITINVYTSYIIVIKENILIGSLVEKLLMIYNKTT